MGEVLLSQRQDLDVLVVGFSMSRQTSTDYLQKPMFHYNP